VKTKKKAAFDPKLFLAKVGDGKAISKYQKDQIVFHQGDVADAVFYIQSGKVKLTVVSERGKEAVVGILEPRHFFGEACLNGHPLRVTTATAIDPSLINYAHHQSVNDYRFARSAGIFRIVYGGFVEPEQSN
jgi:CRP/FNR family transcriptional regulator, cyclic AMP receptor protein